jgi:hypothetical protein
LQHLFIARRWTSGDTLLICATLVGFANYPALTFFPDHAVGVAFLDTGSADLHALWYASALIIGSTLGALIVRSAERKLWICAVFVFYALYTAFIANAVCISRTISFAAADTFVVGGAFFSRAAVRLAVFIFETCDTITSPAILR